jgi:hypothetical protein
VSQFRLLFNNAWRRFTRLDGLARDTDPRSVLILAAIVFGTPGIVLAFFLAGFGFGMIDARPILNELAYYSGLLVALAALLEWDALLPDRADGAVLAPLPVPPRRLVAAHGAALAALLGLLTLCVNISSMVLIPLLDWTGGGILSAVARQAAAVIITASIAFCSVLGLRALALGCTGVRGLRRIGTVMQLAGLVAVISALLLLTGLSEPDPAWKRRFHSSPLPLAGWAGVVVLAAICLYVLSAYRAFRPETHPRGRHSGLRFWRLWGGSTPEAAVARFASLTLARCRRQRMVVGAWFALGAGVVLASGLSLASHRQAPAIAAIGRVAISVPLVLAFFLLAGLRNSFAVPVELRANWVFRLGASESGDLAASARRLMGEYLAVLLLPAAGFTFWCWPAHVALAQLAFLAVAGAAWIQCLTWNLHTIPFSCSYQPGGANLPYVWPLYALGFGVGAFALAGWEQWLLEDGRRLAIALAVMLAALVWSEHHRRGAIRSDYVFEDDPEPAVQTLLGG